MPGQGGAKADDNPLGWTAKAASSYVGTGGNAEATSLGFKFNASYNWTRTYFTLLGSGVRADSTTIDRFAVGPSETDFTPVEVEDKQKTAENYVLDATARPQPDRAALLAGGRRVARATRSPASTAGSRPGPAWATSSPSPTPRERS